MVDVINLVIGKKYFFDVATGPIGEFVGVIGGAACFKAVTPHNYSVRTLEDVGEVVPFAVYDAFLEVPETV